MSLPPHDRAANLVLWAVICAALAGWQILTARRQLPTIATVVRRAREWWPSRLVLLLGWAWLGWHLFVRTSY
jgi:hypothetical protein